MNTLLLDFLYLLSSEESDYLNDESDDDGYDSGSSGTCDFTLSFDESIGRVSGLGSGVFFSIGVKSKCDVDIFFWFM